MYVNQVKVPYGKPGQIPTKRRPSLTEVLMEVARIISHRIGTFSRRREVERLPGERRYSEIKHESRRSYNSGDRTELREATTRRHRVIGHYRSVAITQASSPAVQRQQKSVRYICSMITGC